MDKWMDDGLVDRQMNRYTDVGTLMDIWIWMDGYIDGWMNR